MIQKIDNFDYIKIGLASPETIREWSKGEIKKPETINYRTFKPEKEGLFCEKTFGPTKDYECACGKYKRIKHKGIVCDRCGVEVTVSRVRRERMGHIFLASPCTHIWFFKSLPSRIGNLLGLNVRQLEKVIYYEEYVVVDPGQTPLKKCELLSDAAYNECVEKYGQNFKAKMGAEAIVELLQGLDLKKLSEKLKRDLKKTKTEQTKKRILKAIKIVDSFINSDNKPEWMILTILPVIPPDLRPLVPLDGGRFATSDLNDLYRRVINRNNRLKKLIDLRAPEVIVRNEKRMLQEAVDALLDNGRHGRPVLGHSNRPLKSISDMLKGKQGRFRQNLLGKRVDYSGRSVIVVGPELKLHECGLPKKMALELFEPFIIKRLKEKGFVHTIKSAKKMVESAKVEVWDILDEVIRDHPVLLNRAPTLHRLGIQAFQPVLVEGKAIRVHPLVCPAFNADFDGDQMAVHVPLSLEAQIECRVLVLSVNNIFSPSDGRPIMTPGQDIVLGCYYLTLGTLSNAKKDDLRTFRDTNEVITAFQDDEISLHDKASVRIDGEMIETTVGRVIFNDSLPEGSSFVNDTMSKSKLSKVISDCYNQFGHQAVVNLLDDLKKVGFQYATKAGISIAVSDLDIPEEKRRRVEEAMAEVHDVEEQYLNGIITDGERYNKIVDIWTHATDQVSDYVFKALKHDNPIFMMADSGARGSKQQIRQLAGMRGLMAKPSGEIIENPITANFREGLTVLEYFISSHGARKGLADTALKTADSGYLTRRLVDVAQDIIISQTDCGTLNGIIASAIIEGDDVVVSLKERIVGRVALDNIADVISDQVFVRAGDVITSEKAEQIENAGIERIKIRSVLTCESEKGVCAKCYGINLATHKMVESGEAVGIIAAQSIGEPGTQLTMRTFHIGGTASRIIEQSNVVVKNSGIIHYHNLRTAHNKKTDTIIALSRNGHASVNDETGRELERYNVPQGATLHIPEDGKIAKGQVLLEWDPYTSPIITEIDGKAVLEDLVDGITVKDEYDEATGLTGRVVIEHRSDYHPQIIVYNKAGEKKAVYPLPSGAHILVKSNRNVDAGDILAKTPRTITKTKDITGGLPRVAELFEARKPADPAIIAEIDGTVEVVEHKKGQRKVIITNPSGMQKEYVIPHGKHLNCYTGDRVLSGDRLVDGPVVLQDVLKVSGDRKLQEYLVNEVQEVYRLQGVVINDKHIEIIVRQMLKKVKIEEPGDTNFLQGDQVDKIPFLKENRRVEDKGKEPAQATPILMGITKSSLDTESFISAASFQETTRILTNASASGKIDNLIGLKENVIMGHLIPAGTGYASHRSFDLIKETNGLEKDPASEESNSEEVESKEETK